MSPQTRKVYDLLKSGRSLTRLIAMHYDIQNLTARISELRNGGYKINCVRRRDVLGQRYGEFHLATQEEGA